MSIKDTIENVDWNRVGMDAAAVVGGGLIAGPGGAVAGFGVAEGARAVQSHRAGDGQTGGTTEGSEG